VQAVDPPPRGGLRRFAGGLRVLPDRVARAVAPAESYPAEGNKLPQRMGPDPTPAPILTKEDPS